MKKSTISILVFLLSSILISCGKESLDATQAGPAKAKIDSGWFPLSFTLVTTTLSTHNSVFLTGDHAVNSKAPKTTGEYVQLAFMKGINSIFFPDTGTTFQPAFYRYYSIPSTIQTANENTGTSYEVKNGLFSVHMWNADTPTQAIDPGQFESYRFRFVVVEKTVFQKLTINWNNYFEVAAALQLNM